jgi:hypothetical protein
MRTPSQNKIQESTMVPNPNPDIESETLQLQDAEFRAKALHHLEGDPAPNIFDRLADACRQKIAVLEELNCLARLEELKIRQCERSFSIFTERIQ